MKIRNCLNSFIRAIVLVTFTFSSIALAQEQLPVVIPPSPTSVQFQRYGEHSVGHFTGVPEITIPIFTIQEGDITVPITMSYHASGFRRHEPDGHVGMGWMLNTGGMVTREIRGLPDDMAPVHTPDASYGIMSPDHPGISDYPYLNDLYKKSLYSAADVDHEIDIYSYNFLGRSGQYIRDPNNSNRLTFLQLTDLKLDDIEGFQDPNGITYYFGGPTGVETQWVDVNNAHYQTSTTFHMSSILSSRYPGRGVSYQYQEGKIFSIFNTTNSENWQYMWDYGINPTAHLYAPEELLYPPLTLNNQRVSSMYLPFSTYTTKFPSQISFSSGAVTFQFSAQKLLERIDVRNYQGLLIKRITFEYGTLEISGRNASKLKAIVYRDATNQEIERYSFEYYNEYSAITRKGSDHWGFYNADTYDDIVPFTEDVVRTYWQDSADGLTRWVAATTHFNLSVGGRAHKIPDFGATRTYTLSKITYPTGGFTEFEYELHQDVVNQAAGGLRIKMIKSYASSGLLSSQKEYVYQGGYQEVVPSYDLYRKDEDVYGHGIQTYRRLYLNQHLPINPSPHGASVVYGLVTEIEGDHKTSYQYAVGPAYDYKWLRNPAGNTDYDRVFAHNHRPWNYGHLISKTILMDGIQIYWEANGYDEFETGHIHDLVIERAASMHPGYSSEYSHYNVYGTEFFNYSNRYHPIGGKRLVGRSVLKDGVLKSVNNYYENPDYPFAVTKTRTVTSGRDTVFSEMKYPFDYASAPYTTMASDNRQEVVGEERSHGSAGIFMDASRTEMKDWGGDVIAPEFTQFKTGNMASAYQDEIRYHGYDGSGNIAAVSLAHGPQDSYLWAYRETYPILKGMNVTQEQLRTACDSALADLGHNGGWENRGEYFLSLLGNLQGTASKGLLRSFTASLRSYLPEGGQVSVHTYIPLVGMSSSTDAKGNTIYYEYDSFYRLKAVRDDEGNILNTYQYHIR
ncbi:hypothetical protein FAZ19_01165 [Sphingobacterium alkalisoli]|uniref:RHS repeat protein n=1 Tax=Sphingobacterium alkalisoli TaxID=1874115 RepID=A0A4U0H962_9SPHI|nr:hypothetical protein [Sphingobacterium alkalisoli]TJY67904.1 hypothetical protein FAZ19_01165 [Sphingobacterium alkalisoli]GGH10555.1 hypothetical protein GCM10011418_08950 [Sphingobacterium alkalisoli]